MSLDLIIWLYWLGQYFRPREFEERFLKIGIPYRIIGGIKFYERAEIKDCLSYLRIVNQHKDDLAFERIVNVPKRSIGDTTINTISNYAKSNKISLIESSKKLLELNKIKPKTKIGLSSIIKVNRKMVKRSFKRNKPCEITANNYGRIWI